MGSTQAAGATPPPPVTYHWARAVSGKWSNPLNWSPDGGPKLVGTIYGGGGLYTSNDAAVFATGSARTYTVTGVTISNSLTVSGDHVVFDHFINSDGGYGGGPFTVDQNAIVIITATSGIYFYTHDGNGLGPIRVDHAVLINRGGLEGNLSVGDGAAVYFSGKRAGVYSSGLYVAARGLLDVRDGAVADGLYGGGGVTEIDGTLNVIGTGSAAQFGAVTGTGDILIGRGGAVQVYAATTGSLDFLLRLDSTLTFGQSVGAGTSITFAGLGSTVSLAASLAVNPNDDKFDTKASIFGFRQGDTIQLTGLNVTSADFIPGLGGTGTLALFNGTASAGSLRVEGSYHAHDFVVSGDRITLVPGSVQTASPVPATYHWAQAVSGKWSNPLNWSPAGGPKLVDISAGGGAKYLSFDKAMFASGSTRTYVVTGEGISNAMVVAGDHVVFDGFTNNDAGYGGSLTVDQHAIVMVTASSVLNYAAHDGTGSGPILVDGATLIDHGQLAGDLSVGSAAAVYLSGSAAKLVGNVNVAAGGLLDVRYGAFVDGSTGGGASLVEGTLNVVGTGCAAKFAMLNGNGGGAIVIGRGGAVQVSAATDGVSFLLRLDSTLTLGGSVDSYQGITFAGPGSTVSLAADASSGTSTMDTKAPIFGFAQSDAIQLTGINVTSADFIPGLGGTGTLDLFNGIASAGSLMLDGYYHAHDFVVAGDRITLVPGHV